MDFTRLQLTIDKLTTLHPSFRNRATVVSGQNIRPGKYLTELVMTPGAPEVKAKLATKK